MINLEYNNKKYPIELNLFLEHSQYFSGEKEKYQDLVLSEFEYSLDFSEDIIIAFIQYFKTHFIEITDNNAITINYLSNKYQVPELIEQTENYIIIKL